MTGETGGPDGEGRKPTPAGYLVGVVMALLIGGGIYLALIAGGNQVPGSAHLATPSSGSTNGVKPDERTGTEVSSTATGIRAAADKAGCTVRLGLPDEGRKHLTRDDPAPEYRTVPPTSGPHIGPPLQQADGAYAGTPRPEDVVHSLEHGRIAIQYDPDLPRKAQLELKGLYDTAYSAALLFPNPEMPFAVAATVWRGLLTCPKFRGQATLDAIHAFGAEAQGHGPESTDLFPPLPGPSFTSG